ncbi:MAG: FMN-binding protein [Bacteroidia bacterium]|nr:MAG: FMN-binding protein [Bacteroidia bacterium]
MVLRKRIQWIGLVTLLIWPVFLSQAKGQIECTPHKKVVKEIIKLFGETLEVIPAPTLKDSASYGEYFHPGDCLYRITEQEEMRGYMLSTSAKGRFDFFDYSVIFSEDKTVLKVIVTVYRSDHGAAICQKNWLGQFEGYHGGVLELGRDIDAVSGGTISSTSMVNDIQRCYLLITSSIAK